jgi:translation elongation factor EF-Tu-like GTPase
MSSSEMVDALAIEGALDTVDPASLQQLVAAVVREYAKRADSPGGYFPIVPTSTITATDAMIACTALLKSVNIAVFELGLWQSWAGGIPQEVPA